MAAHAVKNYQRLFIAYFEKLKTFLLTFLLFYWLYPRKGWVSLAPLFSESMHSCAGRSLGTNILYQSDSLNCMSSVKRKRHQSKCCLSLPVSTRCLSWEFGIFRPGKVSSYWEWVLYPSYPALSRSLLNYLRPLFWVNRLKTMFACRFISPRVHRQDNAIERAENEILVLVPGLTCLTQTLLQRIWYFSSWKEN